jgi:hypothetical protein
MQKAKAPIRSVRRTFNVGLTISILFSCALLSILCPSVSGANGWSKTYGGEKGEGLYDIVYPKVLQTNDGGFLLTGDTRSYGAGLSDAYLVKTDPTGNMQWYKTYGGPADESACGVCKTNDGGYAVLAMTNSYGAGSDDFWLLKIDVNGNLQWNKTYGGAGRDTSYTVSQTANGEYVLLGFTNSYGAGGYDAWVVKTDATGNILWSKTYGGAGNDYGGNLIVTADGSYTVVGYSTSFGGYKGWLFMLDLSGNMLWEKTFGIGIYSYACWGIQTSDGGYAIAGATYPSSLTDLWVFKTDSSGNLQWEKTFGGSANDVGWNVAQMTDGGYAIVGETSSYGSGGVDSWLIRTDSSGNMLWDKTYGGTGTEFTDDIIRTSDGGLAIAGFTNSFGAGGYDMWLIRVDEFGVVPEGFSLGLIVLLSSIVVFACAKCMRRPLRITK